MSSFFRSYYLTKKDQKVKADTIGPNAQSGCGWCTYRIIPAMSAKPEHPTQLVFGVPAHGTLDSRREWR